LENIKLVW